MLKKIILLIWYAAAVITVTVSVFISAIRFYPESYQNYLPEIQKKIVSIIGRPVEIKKLHLDWIGYSPHITVDDLSVYSDETKQKRLLFVNEAHLSINIYKSIINKKIDFNRLTLNGGDLKIVRKTNNKVILNGIDISEIIENRKNTKDKSIQIGLLGSTVDVQDSIKGLDYFFDRVNIFVKVHKDNIKVTSKFLLPEKLGNSLVLVADVEGYDKKIKELEGSFYTKGESINLEFLSVFFPELQLGIQSGNSDFEVWGDIRSASKRNIKGKVKLSELKYKSIENSLDHVNPNQEITEFETKFNIEGTDDGWKVALLDTHIRASDDLWSGKNYVFECRNCTKETLWLSADIDYINLVNVYSTIQHFDFFTQSHRELLKRYIVVGSFDDTKILAKIKNKTIEKYILNSSIHNLSVSIPDQKLAINSLSGKFKGNHLQGELIINSNSMDVQVLKIFNEPLVNQHITGKINWHHEGALVIGFENMFIYTDNTVANIQGTVQLENEDAYIDFQGYVPEGEAHIVKKYLPYKKMHPKLAKWLNDSIVSGKVNNGRLLFQGNPKLFPFKNNPGRFEVYARVENGVLNYRKDWPQVENISADFIIKNKYLAVNANQGTVLNSELKEVKAQIEDMKLTRLVIDGDANGDASDVLMFLKESSLLPEESQVFKQISANGKINLDLDIILTFSKKIKKERIVSGSIEFDNSNLTITSVDTIPFKNLNGKLYFDQKGAEGKNLKASLYGRNYTGEAYKTDTGRTIINLFGNFDFDKYLSENYVQFHEYIKGVSPVNAILNIPQFGRQVEDKSLLLTIDTNLEGAEITLPQPFDKKTEEKKNLFINTKFEPGRGHPQFVSYNNNVFIESMYDIERKKIAAMEIRFGDDQFQMPSEGLRISGRLSKVNLSPWVDISKKVATPGQDNLIELSEIDVKAKTLSISDFTIDDLSLNLTREEQSWTGSINSSIVSGEFDYPVDSSNGVTAIGNFDYISLTKPEKKSEIDIDPRKLPPLLINTKKFTLDQYSFDDVILKTKPDSNGMLINSLAGRGDQLNVTSSGSWTIDANNKNSTQLDMHLVSENLNSSITGLGFETQIEKGEGYVTSKLNWPGAPYQFSIEKFLGTAKVRFKDGEFSSVNPGAGRFIGLINLGEISKRLSLDFKDFFSKGYVFDKIRADLLFKNGNLTTDNLKIKGTSADILIQGRTGLIAKDYDQTITVTPHISGGLPWVGLAVGGPIGAVGVIVGEKVAESIGVDVNKVTQVKYSMTGTWDDPKLEAISKKVAETSDPYTTQGQPSPQQTIPSNAK